MRCVERLQSAGEQCHLELKSGSRPAGFGLTGFLARLLEGLEAGVRHRVPSRGRSFARQFRVSRVERVVLLLWLLVMSGARARNRDTSL